MIFSRHWGMPTPDTFDCPPIEGFVKRYLMKSQVSVDPFSRNKRWATFTNDINPNTAAESHMDALDFLDGLGKRKMVADLVIMDPPYSPRQIKECYDEFGRNMMKEDALRAAYLKRIRKAINRITVTGSIVLWFGWNSTGMGMEYETLEICLVCHGADHNDTICMAQQRQARHDLEFAFTDEKRAAGMNV